MRNFLRQPITIFTAIAIFAACAPIYYASQRPDYSGITLISNVAVFLASGLISYLVTYNNEREQFSKNMRQLADFAKRRVELLRDNLASLTEVIRLDQDSTAPEIRKFVAYTLTNLSEDAEASVYDIEGMGRIDHGAPLAAANGERKSAPQLPVPAPAGRTVDETISYNCPTCGFSNEASLGSAPGTTKVVTCTNCEARSNLHRISPDRFKVVSHARQASFTRTPRNPNTPSLNTIVSRPRDISFQCPRCQNRIIVKDSDGSPINRICFKCLAAIRYQPMSSRVDVIMREPVAIANIHVAEFVCPNCQNQFFPQIHTSEAQQEFIICHQCNTAYIGTSDEKEVVSRCCPSCDREIKFKLRTKDPDAKHFCFECKTRLLYARATDTVTVAEVLDVPKVSFAEYAAAGRICPHCGSVASLGFTTNASGERLSVCWACKKMFEFVD